MQIVKRFERGIHDNRIRRVRHRIPSSGSTGCRTRLDQHHTGGGYDRREDLVGLSIGIHPKTAVSTLFVFDSAKGRLGFSRAIYEAIESLCWRRQDLVGLCSCGLRGYLGYDGPHAW